ncbi:WW domain-binding protein 11 isoform X2 [Chelonia mydas]|uniref:WW domain-binding protein 11 isoform X2 n=1 Tax=Chelonia mydas TaxID=8469 RepID=UPI001CA98FA1|nr:WW domain-binding protein 11 isoform X2 [Chelonia mydas]
MAESGQGARRSRTEGQAGAGESPGGGASPEPGQRAGAEPGSCPAACSARGPELGSAAPGGGADPSPAERWGPVLMAWLLSLFAKGPEASSRRDRPDGEPDTPMPQLGANRARGAAGTAQELRETAERLQAQLEALKGSSDPETLEFLQALDAPIRIASRVLVENQRLRQEVEELKGRLAAPPPLKPASQPPAHWASSPWTSQTPPSLATRSTAARKTILVVLHHQPKERAELYACSKREAQHPGLLHTVDGCFSTHSGFYHCQANTAAVASVAAALQQLAVGGH